MITVAVTGSNGFIGSNFINAAKGRFNLKLIGRHALHSEFPVAHASLNDEDRLVEVLSGCDAVVHCAHSGINESENVSWGSSIVLAAKRAGVERMVAFGSFATFENSHDVILPSTPTCTAKIPYVIEKLRLEKTLSDLLKADYPALQLAFLQPTIVVGAGGSWDRFARRLKNTDRIYLPSKGNKVCNLVQVDTVVDAICCCLEAPAEFYEKARMRKLLVASDQPTSWADWLAADYHIPQTKILACNENRWAESFKRNMLLSVRYSAIGDKLMRLKQQDQAQVHASTSALPRTDVDPSTHTIFIPEGLDRLTLSCNAVVKGDVLP